MSCLDKHNPNSLHHFEDLHELSKILSNCEKYDVRKFNELSKSINTAGESSFSYLCNNIDGNAKNFKSSLMNVLGWINKALKILNETFMLIHG